MSLFKRKPKEHKHDWINHGVVDEFQPFPQLGNFVRMEKKSYECKECNEIKYIGELWIGPCGFGDDWTDEYEELLQQQKEASIYV